MQDSIRANVHVAMGIGMGAQTPAGEPWVDADSDLFPPLLAADSVGQLGRDGHEEPRDGLVPWLGQYTLATLAYSKTTRRSAGRKKHHPCKTSE
jgi:hypothetical protein